MTLLDPDPPAVDEPAPNQHEALLAEAFTEAFAEHAPRLLQYLSRQVSAAEAEDLLGDTFCVAWRQRNRYEPARGPLVGWLFGIATNLLKKHKRSWLRGSAALARVAVPQDAVDLADAVANRVDAAQASRRLADAVAGLKERDRDVLLLSSWAQLDQAEIAIALDIPIGTVRSRLHRARTQIRAASHPAAVQSTNLDGDHHV